MLQASNRDPWHGPCEDVPHPPNPTGCLLFMLSIIIIFLSVLHMIKYIDFQNVNKALLILWRVIWTFDIYMYL